MRDNIYKMASYFTVPNDTYYLFPSQTLTNPSTLMNLIHNGFAPTRFCMKCHMIFHPVKYHQNENYKLIMSSR